MTYSIQEQARMLDVTKIFNDERIVDAMIDIAEQVAIDERLRPLWIACPLDQMFIMLDGWKEAMLAARDYKHGELSAEMFRARLVILAGSIVRGIVNLECEA